MLTRITWETLPDHYDLSRPGDLKQALGDLVLPKPRGFVVRGSVPSDADRAYERITDFLEEEGVTWAPIDEDGYAMGDVAHKWHTDCRPTDNFTRHSFHRTYDGEVEASIVDSRPALWDMIQSPR